MKKLLSLIVISTVLAFTACTDAELCYQAEHPHTAGVTFVFDWQDQQERPDTMGVIAYRIVNNWKRFMAVNSTTSTGHYVDTASVKQMLTRADDGGLGVDTGTDDGTTDDGTTTDGNQPENGNGSGTLDDGDDMGDNTGDDSGMDTDVSVDTDSVVIDRPLSEFRIRQGEYKFVAFPLDSSEVNFSELAEFVLADGRGKHLNDVNINYREYNRRDPRLRKKVNGWSDYNQYSLYIQPDMEPIYYDTVAIVKVNENEHRTITFRPRPITQNVDIYFDITKDVSKQPFVIDSVWAEIAGVPRTINLSNGHLDITKTDKMMFPTTLSNSLGDTLTPERPDSATSTLVHCHGNIDVTGIVNAQNEDKTSGPGIMQVMIYAHVGEGEDKKVKKIQGEINLYNTIAQANSIKISEDGQWAERNGDHIVLRINALLVIDGEAIIKAEDINDGVDIWLPTNVNLEFDI